MQKKIIKIENFINPDINAGIRLNTLVDTSVDLHKHDFAELILILDGDMLHLINGEKHKIEQGQLIFIRPDDEHGFVAEKTKACRFLQFSFTLESLMELSDYFVSGSFFNNFTAPPLAPVFILSLSETETLASKILKIEAFSSISTEFAAVRVKAVLADIFTEYFLTIRAFNKTDKTPPEWMQRLCRLMEHEQYFIKGLPIMKEVSGRTTEHICKYFKKYLGKTPTAYINELRVKHAAKLLIDTNSKIEAVSWDCGFENLSHFYHEFKKYFNTSPSRYRKKMEIFKIYD